MLTFLTTGLLCLSFTSVADIPSLDLTIESTYVRNKKIWGTYKQNSEKTFIKFGRRKKTKVHKFALGDVVIKKGKIHFIKHMASPGRIEFLAESFKYKKEGKRNYLLDTTGKEELLKALYHNQLKTILAEKGLDITKTNITLKQAKCSIKKAKIKCSFPMSLRI